MSIVRVRFISLLLAGTALLFGTTPAGGTRILLTGGTQIPVRLAQKVDSGTANVGDVFNITVDKEVDVDGWVVIPQGAGGQGEVTSVDHAGGNGHAGSLGLKFDFVYAADGEKVLLSSSKSDVKGDQKKGASSTATIIGYATLGLGGLFAHNFVHGRNIVLNAASKPFTVFVDHTVHVVATQRAQNTDQFAH